VFSLRRQEKVGPVHLLLVFSSSCKRAEAVSTSTVGLRSARRRKTDSLFLPCLLLLLLLLLTGRERRRRVDRFTSDRRPATTLAIRMTTDTNDRDSIQTLSAAIIKQQQQHLINKTRSNRVDRSSEALPIPLLSSISSIVLRIIYSTITRWHFHLRLTDITQEWVRFESLVTHVNRIGHRLAKWS
jgi:hypothetical protein